MVLISLYFKGEQNITVNCPVISAVFVSVNGSDRLMERGKKHSRINAFFLPAHMINGTDNFIEGSILCCGE